MKAHGVTTKILTGDNDKVTRTICKQVGLEVRNMLLGSDLDHMTDRPDYKVEKVVDGYTGFLFLDKDGMPLVAMYWEHRFNHMVSRYNEIYKVQIPNITPHGRVIIRTS